VGGPVDVGKATPKYGLMVKTLDTCDKQRRWQTVTALAELQKEALNYAAVRSIKNLAFQKANWKSA